MNPALRSRTIIILLVTDLLLAILIMLPRCVYSQTSGINLQINPYENAVVGNYWSAVFHATGYNVDVMQTNKPYYVDMGTYSVTNLSENYGVWDLDYPAETLLTQVERSLSVSIGGDSPFTTTLDIPLQFYVATNHFNILTNMGIYGLNWGQIINLPNGGKLDFYGEGGGATEYFTIQYGPPVVSLQGTVIYYAPTNLVPESSSVLNMIAGLIAIMGCCYVRSRYHNSHCYK